ncbi:MAG: non-homologous end-joining DNA ligase [Ilumatobacteraceae bacterium]|jgi:bifunctional non-homologous end joining protein LigD
MTLSFPVQPMKATLTSLPPEAEDDRWAYEIKWDGYRTILFVDTADERVRVQSSSGLDATATYRELGGIWRDVNATTAILDGEIVVFDPQGRPSFEALQRHDTQVVFQAFDVLTIDRTDVINLPYEQRRQLLSTVLEPGSNWTVPAHRIGGGAELLAATAERGLEGVIAKRLGSPYQPGKRTPNWRKVKNRTRVEVVIGGISAGKGNRVTSFGSLLVGRYDGDGVLRFAGGVGTGFSQRTLADLSRRFSTLLRDECPFSPVPPREYTRDARWLEPELRCEIEIAEFTNEGYVRHASFLHLV